MGEAGDEGLLPRAFLRRDELAADALLLGLWRRARERYTADDLAGFEAALANFHASRADRLDAETRVRLKLFAVAAVCGAPADCCCDPRDEALEGVDDAEAACFARAMRRHFADAFQGRERDPEADVRAAAAAVVLACGPRAMRALSPPS